MKVIKILMAGSLVLSMAACNNTGLTKNTLDTAVDSASYALGMDMGLKIKANFEDMNTALFARGLNNAIDSTDFLIENEEIPMILQAFFQQRQEEKMAEEQAKALQKAEAEFGEVKAEGLAFLEENKSKKGVQVTESGLQYLVRKEGKGDKPTAASNVKVHYHGTLIDGTVFDSSVDRNEPASFSVNRVISGWTEGLQLMKVGAKYTFFIPQELAYGAFPRQGGAIRPFDVLIFEVELLEILK